MCVCELVEALISDLETAFAQHGVELHGEDL